MAMIQATYTGIPSSHDPDYAAYDAYSWAQGYDVADSTNYSTLNLTRGSDAVTYAYYKFDTSSIPANATIISVSCRAKCIITNTNSSRIKTRQIQMFSGTTAKGSAHTLSTSTTAFDMTCGTWTRQELEDCRIRLYAVRGSSQSTSSFYIRFYGADLTVEYEYSDVVTGDTIYVKQNGAWVEATDVLLKVNNAWQSVSNAYKKVNGTWVEQDDKSAMFDTNAIYKKGENN